MGGGFKRGVSRSGLVLPFLSISMPFFSLLFWISLVHLKRGISLVILVFSLSFPRIVRVRQGQKILGNCRVFLDKNQQPRKRRTGLCPFWDFPDFCGIFPDLLGDGPGIFPICPFPLSRPIKSTYAEQSRKGPRHNLDPSRKKWETPRFGNPPVFSFSQLWLRPKFFPLHD